MHTTFIITQSSNFYRATLCDVFAVVAWCLSVRPSVCHVDALYPHHTAVDIVKLLCRPDRAVILVFRPQRRYPIPRGTLERGGGQNKTGGKFLRFLTEIAVYLGNGTRQAHGCYGILIGSHMRSIEW